MTHDDYGKDPKGTLTMGLMTFRLEVVRCCGRNT